MAEPNEGRPPLTAGQNRVLVVLCVIIGVASIAIPLIWNAGEHDEAIWSAVGLGLAFWLSAFGLSRSIARTQHRGTWSVLFLRRRDN